LRYWANEEYVCDTNKRTNKNNSERTTSNKTKRASRVSRAPLLRIGFRCRYRGKGCNLIYATGSATERRDAKFWMKARATRESVSGMRCIETILVPNRMRDRGFSRSMLTSAYRVMPAPRIKRFRAGCENSTCARVLDWRARKTFVFNQYVSLRVEHGDDAVARAWRWQSVRIWPRESWLNNYSVPIRFAAGIYDPFKKNTYPQHIIFILSKSSIED